MFAQFTVVYKSLLPISNIPKFLSCVSNLVCTIIILQHIAFQTINISHSSLNFSNYLSLFTFNLCLFIIIYEESKQNHSSF